MVLLGAVLALAGVAGSIQSPALAQDAAPIAPAVAVGHIDAQSFWSATLGRTMPYRVYLPPGYADGTRRYATLYLLHGMGGSDREWQDLGIASAADRLIAAGQIAPLIIVMPEGARSYWVDHASGGVSMGAQGALQLALNYPGEFGAVGAHSLVLRRFDSIPSYFGNAAEFAKRDPMQIVPTRGAGSCTFALWIDIGASDPWTGLAEQFESELTDLGVRHEWHLWAGDHSGSYWSAHLDDYLRFYNASLNTRAARSSLS